VRTGKSKGSLFVIVIAIALITSMVMPQVDALKLPKIGKKLEKAIEGATSEANEQVSQIGKKLEKAIEEGNDNTATKNHNTTSKLDNGIGKKLQEAIDGGSNSTKITTPKNSKDLTTQDTVVIKLAPTGTTAEGKVTPKDIKVKPGTTVVWQNMLPEKVYVESKPDENHYQGQMLNQSYIFPGESREEKLNDIGTFIYDGSNGFGSYYVRGTITVVNDSAEQKKIPIETTLNQSNNYDVSQIKWRNFKNDLEQFSVEYPSQWQTKIGNRFTGGPPLIVENINSDPSLIRSTIEIKVFDNDDKSAQKWTQSDKKNVVDGEKDTKLIEPVTCQAKIDNAQACSFVYATEDKKGRTTANLHLFVNDNASQIHSIKYATDPATYDLEAPVMQHVLNSYKLIKNYDTGMESNTLN
jgi:plastocyanin